MFLLASSTLDGYSLHHSMIIARSCGFDGLELVIDAHNYDCLDGQYLLALSQITDCPILSITTPDRHITGKLMERIFSLADILQVRSVNVYPPRRLDKKAEWFPDILNRPENTPYSVNVLNVEPKTILWVFSEYKEARPDALKRFTGSTAIDLANIDESSGVSLIKTLSLMGSSLRHVRICDRGEQSARMPLGKGSLPIESFLSKLKNGGYTHTLSLSLDAKSLSLGADEILTEELKKELGILQKEFS